jgi:hypothetical protein
MESTSKVEPQFDSKSETSPLPPASIETKEEDDYEDGLC